MNLGSDEVANIRVLAEQFEVVGIGTLRQVAVAGDDAQKAERFAAIRTELVPRPRCHIDGVEGVEVFNMIDEQRLSASMKTQYGVGIFVPHGRCMYPRS